MKMKNNIALQALMETHLPPTASSCMLSKMLMLIKKNIHWRSSRVSRRGIMKPYFASIRDGKYQQQSEKCVNIHED
jgi:hypothetical protein